MKGRHPVRAEMKAIFKAESRLREKQFLLKKKQRELERTVAQMNEDIEDTIREMQVETEKLAEICNVAPSTNLDTVAMKWVTVGADRKPETIDFSKEEEPPHEKSEPNGKAEAHA